MEIADSALIMSSEVEAAVNELVSTEQMLKGK